AVKVNPSVQTTVQTQDKQTASPTRPQTSVSQPLVIEAPKSTAATGAPPPPRIIEPIAQPAMILPQQQITAVNAESSVMQRVRNDEELARENGPISVIVKGDVFKDASVISRFYFDEERVLREFYRGNVHFEILDAIGNKTGELRNSMAEINPGEQDWYISGNYRIKVDRDLNEHGKAGDTIETLEQWQQRRRVFFYDTDTRARLSEVEVEEKQPGEFRVFFLPPNITIDQLKAAKVDGMISLGAQEIIAGQNAIKHKNTLAMIAADKARNTALVADKLGDTRASRFDFPLAGGVNFNMRVLAMKVDDGYYPTWICYEDTDKTFKVKVLDKTKNAWVNELDRSGKAVVYHTEEDVLNILDNTSRFMLQDGKWYDADRLDIKSKVIKAIDRQTGQEVLRHVELGNVREINKAREDAEILKAKIDAAEAYLDMLRNKLEKKEVSIVEFNVQQNQVNILKGWGGNATMGIEYRSASELPVNPRVVSTPKGKIYYDANGTQITYGLKAVQYRIQQLQSQPEDTDKIIEGLKHGMVMVTDIAEGKTTILTGQRAVKEYNAIRVNLQKTAPESIRYNKATNTFEYTENGKTYKVVLSWGIEGANSRILKIRDEFSQAKLFSYRLKNGGVVIKSQKNALAVLVNQQLAKLYPGKSPIEVRESINASIRANLENVKALIVELSKDELSAKDLGDMDNLINYLSGKYTSGIDLDKLLRSEYAPLFAAEYYKALLAEVNKSPDYDYKAVFNLYALFINGAITDEGIDKGIIDAYKDLEQGVTQEKLNIFKSRIQMAHPDMFHWTFFDFANNKKVQVDYSPMKFTRLMWIGDTLYFEKG
ncbi:MAG: hypothetical protein KKH57_07330, partial [Candidatus Omnitrophica bacterium]|nr:hypothetical protein [Candidatus Omnitrophota bacterium]